MSRFLFGFISDPQSRNCGHGGLNLAGGAPYFFPDVRKNCFFQKKLTAAYKVTDHTPLPPKKIKNLWSASFPVSSCRILVVRPPYPATAVHFACVVSTHRHLHTGSCGACVRAGLSFQLLRIADV